MFRHLAGHYDGRFEGLVAKAFRAVDNWREVTDADAPTFFADNIKIGVRRAGETEPDVDAILTHLRVAPEVDGPISVSGDVQLTIPKRFHLPADELMLTDRQAPGVKVSGLPLQVSLDATLHKDARLAVTMTSRTPSLHVSHRKIASTRVDFAPASVSAELVRHRIDAGTVHWELKHLTAQAEAGGIAQLKAELRLDNSKSGGMLKTTVALPDQDCHQLHRSIPTAMLPGMTGAEFKGRAEIALEITAPLSSVNKMDMKVATDFRGCWAENLGPNHDVAAMNRRDAVFHVHDPRLPKPVRVGPGTGNWSAYVPWHVIGSALATEDGAFFSHTGFSPGLLMRGLRMNLRTRRYAYGGSTITQQLVKNIFLRRTKTLARKLEEAVLVWQVERHVPKSRIMRMYLNCIEYGPGIYGIRRAAGAYFGTGPGSLKPIEGAYIMNIKPFPRQGYYLFKSRAVTGFWRARSQMIRKKLLKYGMITREQAEEMTPESLYDRFKPKEVKDQKSGADQPTVSVKQTGS